MFHMVGLELSSRTMALQWPPQRSHTLTLFPQRLRQPKNVRLSGLPKALVHVCHDLTSCHLPLPKDGCRPHSNHVLGSHLASKLGGNQQTTVASWITPLLFCMNHVGSQSYGPTGCPTGHQGAIGLRRSPGSPQLQARLQLRGCFHHASFTPLFGVQKEAGPQQLHPVQRWQKQYI